MLYYIHKLFKSFSYFATYFTKLKASEITVKYEKRVSVHESSV